MAKAVALKLFHERLHVFGVEGFGHADVVVENMASRGVCSSLGGEAMWSDYWLEDIKLSNTELTDI